VGVGIGVLPGARHLPRDTRVNYAAPGCRVLVR
jgi:hypothetical protein